MAILLAAILILPAYGSRLFAPGPNAIVGQPTAAGDQQAGVISQPTEGLFATPTLTDTIQPSQTITFTVTATRKPTLKPSRTATRRATATTAQNLQPVNPTAAITCGVPLNWVIYIVQPGDTLISLARRTNTTISQLQAANCMGYSTLLYAGMNFYLPYLPVPEIPTWAPPSSTAAPSATRSVPTQTSVPSSTPVPVLPSPTAEPPTPAPPTVMPSPVVPTATPVTPGPGSIDPTSAQTGREG